MSVLTLAGKAIDWASPPKATDKVMWSRKTTSGRDVIGSLRAIAHLDHLDNLAFKKYGVHVEVIQPPFNDGVEASEGTHDLDMTFDAWIPGVSGNESQRFIRANGGGAYLRTPEQGFTLHLHYFTLPERQGADVSDDYAAGGFRVGKYVDGGWSTAGARVASSQIEDYYAHKDALASHAHDPSWFPASIEDSIFDLPAYISRQRQRMEPNNLTVQTANVEDKERPPLGKSLRQVKPHVVAIQQGGEASDHLRTAPGYRLSEFVRGSEAREIKMLTRDGSKITRIKRLNMGMRWIGPKISRVHEPRTYMAVRIDLPFKVWVLDVHFPTGGPDGPNALAWHESWRRTMKFLRRRRGVVVGDFNATHEELALLLKSENLGFLLTSLGKVDHAISNRLRRTRVQRTLPGTPSDVHGWGAVSYAPIKK